MASGDNQAMVAVLAASSHQWFPMLDGGGKVVGVLERREAELAIRTGTPPKLAKAEWVAAKATVGTARKRMLSSGADFLCVGDESTGELSGVLTLHDLLRGESVLEDDEA
jgi:CBS domain-containing protein